MPTLFQHEQYLLASWLLASWLGISAKKTPRGCKVYSNSQNTVIIGKEILVGAAKRQKKPS
jgi:hypothetical protein